MLKKLREIFINRLLTSVFVLVNGIVFNRSNALMIKCLIAYVKYFSEVKRLAGLQKAEAYSEPKRAYTMELFVNILYGLLF